MDLKGFFDSDRSSANDKTAKGKNEVKYEERISLMDFIKKHRQSLSKLEDFAETKPSNLQILPIEGGGKKKKIRIRENGIPSRSMRKSFLNNWTREIFRPFLYPSLRICLDNNLGNLDVVEEKDHGLVWATPKHRRSVDVRRIRRLYNFRDTPFRKYCTPKTNIITCPIDGNYHEQGTICTMCYNRVKKESEKVKESWKKNDYYYSQPIRPTNYFYENESEIESFHNVPVKGKRPSWFSSMRTMIKSIDNEK
ncbi:hypothetical protein SNEBB_001081 [Seison nebaliae]|nr:hypothetical protein SNEBB_001081 [Seison nebaliae]